MYFNTKLNRSGHLFQGPYRAVLVRADNYLLHLSRYIHLNPLFTTKGPKRLDPCKDLTLKALRQLEKYNYSSYGEYIGLRKTKWVKPDFILEYFNNNKDNDLINKNSYKDFIKSYEVNPKEILGNLILE